LHLRLSAGHPPSIRNRFINWKNPAVKPCVQVPVQSFLQNRTPFAWSKKLYSKSDFCKREDTHEKGARAGRSSHCLTSGFGAPRRLNSESTFVSSRNPLIGRWGARSPFAFLNSALLLRTEIPLRTAPGSSVALSLHACVPSLAGRRKRDRAPHRGLRKWPLSISACMIRSCSGLSLIVICAPFWRPGRSLHDRGRSKRSKLITPTLNIHQLVISRGRVPESRIASRRSDLILRAKQAGQSNGNRNRCAVSDHT
jgi:hypothetical protein